MLVTALLLSLSAPRTPYHFSASFIECCSCKDVCVSEITGRDVGCHGFGAIRFKSGSFGGKSLAGTACAFAWDSGKWVRIYFDGPPSRRETAALFMRAVLKDWGTLESVHRAGVEISRASGGYVLKVDGGATAELKMKPIFGADRKTPVCHTNLSSPLHSSLNQGETQTATFSDMHPFNLEKTNGFFYMNCKMSGRL